MVCTDTEQAGNRSDSIDIGTLYPPVIAAQVTALPRDAQVEWTSLGLSIPMSGDTRDRPVVVSSRSGATDASTDVASSFPVHTIRISGCGVKYAFYHIRRHSDYDSLRDKVREEEGAGWELVQSDVFFVAGRVGSKIVDELFVDQCNGMLVPCHGVWFLMGAGEGKDGGAVIAALRCRYERDGQGADM